MSRWVRFCAIRRELRRAFRSLRATPTFTGVALLVLTLGICVSTAAYSVVDAVILRILPFDQPDRLVVVGEASTHASDPSNVEAPNYLDWRAQQDVFTGLAATTADTLVVRRTTGTSPVALRAQRVSADFFTVFRVWPRVGRSFSREDEADDQPGVAIISDGAWQQYFGGTDDVVGRMLPGVQGDVRIVGVMPAGFDYPLGTAQPTQVWLAYVASQPIEHEVPVEGGT